MSRSRVQVVSMQPAGSAAASVLDARLETRVAVDEDVGVLAPRGVGAILDTSLQIFAARFALCTGLALALWLPAKVAEEMMHYSAFREAGAIGVTYLTGVLAYFTQFLEVAFLAPIVVGRLTGRDVGVADAFALFWPRLPGLLLMGVVLGFLTVIGSCCLLPGWILQWLFYVAPVACVVEGKDVPGAVSRSANLAKGWSSFGRWVGVTVVAGMMLLPFSLTPQGFGTPMYREAIFDGLGIRGGAFDLVAVCVAALFLAIATGFNACLVSVYYVDQRVRKEGYDLERELAARRSSAEVPGVPA